jgi:hypothetical protein
MYCSAIRDNNPNLCRDTSSDFAVNCVNTCSVYEMAPDVKSTLETSGEDLKSTLETSILFLRSYFPRTIPPLIATILVKIVQSSPPPSRLTRAL